MPSRTSFCSERLSLLLYARPQDGDPAKSRAMVAFCLSTAYRLWASKPHSHNLSAA